MVPAAGSWLVTRARCPNKLVGHLGHLRETKDLFGNVAKSPPSLEMWGSDTETYTGPLTHEDAQMNMFEILSTFVKQRTYTPTSRGRQKPQLSTGKPRNPRFYLIGNMLKVRRYPNELSRGRPCLRARKPATHPGKMAKLITWPSWPSS